jgi:hypothetical protein
MARRRKRPITRAGLARALLDGAADRRLWLMTRRPDEHGVIRYLHRTTRLAAYLRSADVLAKKISDVHVCALLSGLEQRLLRIEIGADFAFEDASARADIADILREQAQKSRAARKKYRVSTRKIR